MSSTVTMNGNSTGYGAAQGSETFEVGGYDNIVLLAGADDSVSLDSGSFDTIDLNSTGFAHGVTDVVDFGASAFNTLTTSHDLYGADLSVSGDGGPNMVVLANHGGSTNVQLGYVGDAALQGQALGNRVILNGDATNTVGMTGGGSATVAIGAVADGCTGYTSTVALSGVGNTLMGGDENFLVTNAAARLNTIALGDGNNTVSLTGIGNSLSFGSGDNTVSLGGGHNDAVFGGGSNDVTSQSGWSRLVFAAGHAGAQDSIGIERGVAHVRGGDENFSITSSAHDGMLWASLGNGNNVIDLAYGNARLVLGTDTANTAQNQVTLAHGGANLTLNGGRDVVALGGTQTGADKVVLNGTMLGTQLTMSGAFDSVTLTHDADATINDTGTNAGLSITIDADSAHGFGAISITGLSNDDLAQIRLSGASAYTVTSDDTAAGGITLHFAQGSIDLVGMQSVPSHLFMG